MGWELISTILAAALSAGAAIYAAWAAAKAKASEVEATRLRELEQRLSERKMEIYGRIMAALGNLLIPEEARRLAPKAPKNKPGGDSLDSAIFDFMNDVVIYGSDDVLRAFTRFRLASDANPPAPVIIRLVSDFMLAIRRDLDGGQSAVTGVELIGMRINGCPKPLRYSGSRSRLFALKTSGHRLGRGSKGVVSPPVSFSSCIP